MNLIVTMNGGGDFIPPNALRSHMSYAARCHALYLQFVDRGDALLVKMGALAGHFGGSRVLWIDGDTIIRDDCPNLFDAVPRDMIGAVQNDQGDTHGADCMGIHESSWDYSRKALGLSEEDAPFDQSVYVNTGVVVSTPELHQPLFDSAFQVIKKMDAEHKWEKDQSIVSILCQQAAAKCDAGEEVYGRLHLLPHCFNRFGPEVVARGTTAMSAYIQHYAPVGAFRPDKFKYLSLTNWQTATMPAIDYRCTVTPGTGVLLQTAQRIKAFDAAKANGITTYPEPIGV